VGEREFHPLRFKSKWHQRWPQFLEQHNSLVKSLDDHASLLVEMQNFCAENSNVQNAVQKRLNVTENLIATFKQSSELLAEATLREGQVLPEEPKASNQNPEREILTPKSKKQKITEKSTDPSGLFMVDPTPTPLNKLMKEKPTVAVRANEGQKRRVRDDEELEAPVTEQEKSDRKIKRPRKKRSNDESLPQSKSEPVGEPAAEADDAEEDFAKAVEARVRAKEERRKAKAERKRKRSINDSMDVAMEKGVLEPNKKAKGKHVTDNTSIEAPNLASTASNGMPPPQKTGAKRKDSAEEPAIEQHFAKKHGKDDLADKFQAPKRPHNDGTNGGAPAKRARKRKSSR
jgi:hypothetical protein